MLGQGGALDRKRRDSADRDERYAAAVRPQTRCSLLAPKATTAQTSLSSPSWRYTRTSATTS
jgi:hypothetical protein